jgi:streptogramin lyase
MKILTAGFFVFWLATIACAARLELVAGGGSQEKDGPALECRLREPFGVEFSASGEMVIVEMVEGNRVLQMDKKGWLTCRAGTGAKGFSGDNGPAREATFNGIHNLAVLPSGDLLLADSFNHVLRRINAVTGRIETVAGKPESAKGAPVAKAGPFSEATFSTLIQIALEPGGRYLFAADIGHRRVCRLDLQTKTFETVAGNGVRGVPQDGGLAAESPLVDPRAAVPDGIGGFYVLERGGNALRYVDAQGRIKTVAGTGKEGWSGDGGPALEATFRGPKHLCMDRDGSVLVADAENHVIRRFDPKTNRMSAVAGTGKAGMGAAGGDPLGTDLRRPHGVTIGPDGFLYITDTYNNRILRLIP